MAKPRAARAPRPDATQETRGATRRSDSRNLTERALPQDPATRRDVGANLLAGIDLFVCRCIEGVQLNRAATPVTYPPQLTRRQPPQTARCRCLQRFRAPPL